MGTHNSDGQDSASRSQMQGHTLGSNRDGDPPRSEVRWSTDKSKVMVQGGVCSGTWNPVILAHKEPIGLIRPNH